jgi:N-acetylglucosaminyldiphosphoundecaprenol N-acetyl-beta-D-mannosaminyltransferase
MSPLVEKILSTDRMPVEEILKNGKGIYTFLNPVSYLDALKHKELFTSFDGIFADGGLLVKAIKIAYGAIVKRRSFDMTSLAPIVFSYAVKAGKSVAIVATKQEMVEKAVANLEKSFQGLNIVYYRNGYFNGEQEMDDEAMKIVSLHPDILIVGMGVIKQEQFLLKVRNAGYQGIGFTCGGFIHQTSQDKAEYYPDWVDKHGLRFVYRMYKEPHTRKRYAKAAFVFPVRFMLEKLTGK